MQSWPYFLYIYSQALQYVLIPMFQVSFERGEGDALIGGPPSPEQDKIGRASCRERV